MPALGRRYRGVLEVARLGASPPAVRLVNQLDVEEYLRGMGEVLDPAWPPASLRAQAVAARTYALRAMAAAGEICADQRCQVYLGQQAEYPAMDRAVAETAGQVLTFDGKLASTVYSANAGGKTASREEGFGPAAAGSDASFPYLRATPYGTDDFFPWSVRIALTTVAARLGYRGDVSSVNPARIGPSGRVLSVSVDGSEGSRAVSGVDFAAALGLRSTLFSLRLGTADGAPQVPSPSAIQLPPEDGGTTQTGTLGARESVLDPWATAKQGTPVTVTDAQPGVPGGTTGPTPWTRFRGWFSLAPALQPWLLRRRRIDCFDWLDLVMSSRCGVLRDRR